MSTYNETIIQSLKFNRTMTLKLLEELSQLKNPEQALAYQPGPQRAHIGWQLMHIAITQEVFATKRLRDAVSDLSDWIPLFQKGSVAGSKIPTTDVIYEVLFQSRTNLTDTISQITEDQLELIPDGLKERGWSNRTALQVLCWHEAHHQGQAHLLFNSCKAEQSGSI